MIVPNVKLMKVWNNRKYKLFKSHIRISIEFDNYEFVAKKLLSPRLKTQWPILPGP